jgi:hypothetical protein
MGGSGTINSWWRTEAIRSRISEEGGDSEGVVDEEEGI